MNMTTKLETRLSGLSNTAMVGIHNEVTGASLKKFTDKKQAIARTSSVLKASKKDFTVAEVEGKQVVTVIDAVASVSGSRGRKRKVWNGMTLPKFSGHTHPHKMTNVKGRNWVSCTIVLPNGEEVQGSYNANKGKNFFWVLDGQYFWGDRKTFASAENESFFDLRTSVTV